MRQAIAYRETLVHDTDAYRVVFSEADFLPGLIVDRYNDILSLQILTQAMDARTRPRRAARGTVRTTAARAIVERVDAAHPRTGATAAPRAPACSRARKTNTIFTMNGVRFHYDVREGQKTGAFLDQRENYAAAAQYAHGEALDVFCYQGGFALHLAQALQQRDRRRQLASGAGSRRQERRSCNQREMEWIEANAFDLLKDYSTAGRQYDTIVLDPPAFAKSTQEPRDRLRGYKELNLRALKMLRPGGVLVTCSCSYHVSEGEFLRGGGRGRPRRPPNPAPVGEAGPGQRPSRAADCPGNQPI